MHFIALDKMHQEHLRVYVNLDLNVGSIIFGFFYFSNFLTSEFP